MGRHCGYQDAEKTSAIEKKRNPLFAWTMGCMQTGGVPTVEVIVITYQCVEILSTVYPSRAKTPGVYIPQNLAPHLLPSLPL